MGQNVVLVFWSGSAAQDYAAEEGFCWRKRPRDLSKPQQLVMEKKLEILQ